MDSEEYSRQNDGNENKRIRNGKGRKRKERGKKKEKTTEKENCKGKEIQEKEKTINKE